MRPAHLPQTSRFLPDKFRPALIYGSPRVRAFLLCLEPGQGLPPRPDSEELLCFVIQGRGALTIGRECFPVSPGDFAAAAPGERRGIQAQERLVALWVHLSAQEPGNA